MPLQVLNLILNNRSHFVKITSQNTNLILRFQWDAFRKSSLRNPLSRPIQPINRLCQPSANEEHDQHIEETGGNIHFGEEAILLQAIHVQGSYVFHVGEDIAFMMNIRNIRGEQDRTLIDISKNIMNLIHSQLAEFFTMDRHLKINIAVDRLILIIRNIHINLLIAILLYEFLGHIG
ncbi:hypothetical protein D3C71_1697520 [compost metagenome]